MTRGRLATSGARVGVLGALVLSFFALFAAVGASPAFAHAILLTTEPQPGGKFDTSPRAISLRFDEPVEVSLGGIRLYDGDASRVDVGAPEHPGGAGNRVRSSIPNLDDGTYVVTWRVISADSHPVQGAFTFQVGNARSTGNTTALAQRLLSQQGGSTVVGAVYAVARVAIFAAIALLLGAVPFLAVVFPRGRTSRRARIVVWTGWIGLLTATVAGILLEGVYGAALPLTKLFDTALIGDVLGTRYGHVSLLRLALLLALLPLLRMLVPRPQAHAPARRLPTWWYVLTGVLVVALSFTPGLAGHATTGLDTGLAIPADAIHVLAMAFWLGGLVLLFAVVLPRTDPDELREGINRFSTLGFGAIVALVVSGAFQAWRQVGSLAALRDTDYGRILAVKLVVFLALVVAAAFSREIVNRTFRWAPEDRDAGEPEDGVRLGARPVEVPVTVGGESLAAPPPVSSPPRFDRGPSGEGVDEVDDDEPYDDASEVRRLRRSVVVELVLAVLILAVTALLVNAAPARAVQNQPVAMTLRSDQVWIDVVIAPGVAGANDMHFTALPVGNTVVNVDEMTVQLVRPGSDIAPFDVPLRKYGPGHYIAPLYDIPYPGDWHLTVRVRLGATDEAVLVGTFTLR